MASDHEAQVTRGLQSVNICRPHFAARLSVLSILALRDYEARDSKMDRLMGGMMSGGFAMTGSFSNFVSAGSMGAPSGGFGMPGI